MGGGLEGFFEMDEVSPEWVDWGLRISQHMLQLRGNESEKELFQDRLNPDHLEMNLLIRC